ncbi:hypothetical protein XavaCFBP5823_21685, partial [Xanthomonas axonopodis pv. vasculorum]
MGERVLDPIRCVCGGAQPVRYGVSGRVVGLRDALFGMRDCARDGVAGGVVGLLGGLRRIPGGVVGANNAIDAVGHTGLDIGAVNHPQHRLRGVVRATLHRVFGSVQCIACKTAHALGGLPMQIGRHTHCSPGQWPGGKHGSRRRARHEPRGHARVQILHGTAGGMGEVGAGLQAVFGALHDGIAFEGVADERGGLQGQHFVH